MGGRLSCMLILYGSVRITGSIPDTIMMLLFVMKSAHIFLTKSLNLTVHF